MINQNVASFKTMHDNSLTRFAFRAKNKLKIYYTAILLYANNNSNSRRFRLFQHSEFFFIVYHNMHIKLLKILFLYSIKKEKHQSSFGKKKCTNIIFKAIM